MSFKFSPSDPNIICGGCINGQIVLWDISQYAERLKQPRSKRKDTTNTLVSQKLSYGNQVCECLYKCSDKYTLRQQPSFVHNIMMFYGSMLRM